jgi:hypothetical protein
MICENNIAGLIAKTESEHTTIFKAQQTRFGMKCTDLVFFRQEERFVVNIVIVNI